MPLAVGLMGAPGQRVAVQLLHPPASFPHCPPNQPTTLQQLRKLPVLGELHEFIKRENETGAITRQVSTGSG